MTKLTERLRGLFGDTTVNEVAERSLNALEVAETHEFSKHSRHDDYRDVAIRRVCKNNLPFSSTCNSIHKLMGKFVEVTCPYCGSKMTPGNGGGNGSIWSIEYRCRCGGVVGLTLPESGFSAKPSLSE
jgi:hypothetical protein